MPSPRNVQGEGPAGGRYGGGPHPRRRRPRHRSLTSLQKLATTWPKVWLVVLVVWASGRYGGGEGAGYAGEPAPDRRWLQCGAWEQSDLLVRVHLNDTTPRYRGRSFVYPRRCYSGILSYIRRLGKPVRRNTEPVIVDGFARMNRQCSTAKRF